MISRLILLAARHTGGEVQVVGLILLFIAVVVIAIIAVGTEKGVRTI